MRAAGAATGTGVYNLKSESLIASDGASFEVPGQSTLHDMLVAAVVSTGSTRMAKVDIEEGFEDRVLPPFFDTAPKSLWPRTLILEDLDEGDPR